MVMMGKSLRPALANPGSPTGKAAQTLLQLQGFKLLWIKSRASFQGFGHQHFKISFLFLLSGGNICVPVESLGVCFQLISYPQFQAPTGGNGCRGTQGWAETQLPGSSVSKSCWFELKIDLFGTESASLLDRRNVCVCTGGRGNR